ncbi:MAG: class I SAM-dependent methyltransferase [Chloroherpetonaceae bacterium]|nr:class I SAM-dependent methyltransferase [Chloroherpetonaceae bacterium]
MTEKAGKEMLFGGRVWKINAAGREFTYIREGEIIRAEPIPTEEELDEVYSKYYNYKWFEERKLLKKIQGWHRWKRVRRHLQQFVRGKKILDIGCGHGFFLYAAKKDEWDARGVDIPNPDFEKSWQKLGITAYHPKSEELAHLEKQFDVVTMWHSLEHHRNPEEVISSAKKWLKPSGILIIAVPNVNCVGLEKVGADWVWLQEPFVHIWHFSESYLRQLVERHIGSVIRVTTQDTWDAQSLYDAGLRKYVEGNVGKWACKLAAAPTLVFGLEVARKVYAKFLFAFSEATRLATYTLYLTFLKNRRSPNRESELLIFVRNDRV